MAVINEKMVLEYFITQMDKENITFLKGREDYKEKIKNEINTLINQTDMHGKIQVAKNLWKLLFGAAMSYIDPDKRGYDKLFKYFDKYVNFEELIFASDSFYRDHTLHSLWVYFLGEYIVRNEAFNFIAGDMYAEIRSHKTLHLAFEKMESDIRFKENLKFFKDSAKIYECMDSVRCIVAITHDLGYPLKKIGKINKCIKEILPDFSVNNYDEFNFNYSEIQQSFIEGFIEFMNYHLRLSDGKEMGEEHKKLANRVFVFNPNNEEVIGVRNEVLDNLSDKEVSMINDLIKLKPIFLKDIQRYLRYYNDFEQYEHGIMSAFLLMKTINAFRNVELRFCDNNNVDLRDMNMVDFLVKQQILQAVTEHTSDGFQISRIDTAADFLILIDELEEFSRISRANQNRQYVNEFCNTDISVDGEFMQVDFIFDNKNLVNLDPERAFKDKCRRFLTVFDIPKLNENLKLRIRFIGRLAYNNNMYSLEIGRKYASITINKEEQNIPEYLSSNQFYTREEYEMI